MVVPRRPGSRLWSSTFLGLSALSFGCRSKAVGAGDGRPAGSASAAIAPVSAPPAAVSCAPVGAGKSLTVGQANEKALKSDDEEDQDVELPFSVDLGSARASADRFAVGGIQTRSGASYAFLALVEQNGAGGRSVELTRVYGEVDPPAVVPFREGWLAVVADHDASSVVLRLFALGPPFDGPALRRGAEVGSARRDAAEFSLETSGASVLLAFTKLEKGRGLIKLARIDVEKLTLQGTPTNFAVAAQGEAESPRLVRRPGGFFLAYIVRGAAARPKALPAHAAELDGGAPLSLLEQGPSGLEIVPLDEKGVAVSSPRRATPAGARPIAFDLAPSPDGGALLVYRDDRDGPGLARSGVEAVHFRADGSLSTRSWEIAESAGLPALLTDATPPPGRPWAWVFAPSEQASGLAALSADPLAFSEPLADPQLPGAEVLAASRGRLLLGRARGSQNELSVVECKVNPGARVPPPDAGM